MSNRNKMYRYNAGVILFFQVFMLCIHEVGVAFLLIFNMCGVGLAYKWPNLIPKLKGYITRNPINWMILFGFFLIGFLTFVLLPHIPRYVGGIYCLIFTYCMNVSSDSWPDDKPKKKRSGNIEKLKALVDRMKLIHAPRPMPV